MNAFDWRTIALDAPALIEASAGTGKTYTIALLYLRLICERDAPTTSVLVSTFTELAASELTERIGARLKQALAALDGNSGDAALDAYLATLDPARTRTRLQLGLSQIERAPIGTIHSFCRRVLRDFPEDTARGLTLGQAVSGIALVDECVEDFWRRRVLPDPDPRLVHADLGRLKRNVRELLAAGDARVEAPTFSDFELPEKLRTSKAIAVMRAVAGDTRRIAAGRRQVSARLRELCDALEKGEMPDRKWCQQAAKNFTLANLRQQEAAPGALALVAWFADLQRFAYAHAQPASVVSAALAREALDAVRLDLERRLDASDTHTFDALIDGVLRALEAPTGEALARRLQQHYSAALIDEFQDTDPRQWRIFERLFGSRTLLLIGDPKQAIYRFRGGDLLTYLAAKASIPQERQYRLAYNFRSDPRLLRALNALYANADCDPFFGAGIDYVPLLPGEPARPPGLNDCQEPLRIRRFRSEGTPLQARDEAALSACANDIVELLNAAPRIAERALSPGDIAVLLSTNDQIKDLRALLEHRGVPVAASSNESVFASRTASDVQLLLHALMHLGRDSARRAALATPLLGLDALAIHRLDSDPALQARWSQRLVDWRRAFDTGGIAAVLAALQRDVGTQWRNLDSGERIATDVRHLLELSAAIAGTVPEQFEWWQSQRAEAHDGLDSESGRERLLRIASDGQRVQLLTVHKAKGLEFPCVFVPMAWRPPRDKAPAMLRVAENGVRIYDLGSPKHDERKEQHLREDEQENGRRLYVALTRAAHRLYVYTDALAGDKRRGELAALVNAAAIEADGVEDSTVVHRASVARWHAPASAAMSPIPARALPTLPARIAQLSFSALTRHLDATPRAGDESAELETNDVEPIADPHPALLAIDRLRGPRFGNALHRLLEERTPLDRISDIGDALEEEGQPRSAAPQVAQLLARTLDADLGGGLRLRDLPISEQRAELGFQFRVRAGRAQDLFALVGRRGTDESLKGAMVGFIDLVVHWQSRYSLIDYKSNALGLTLDDYQGASLDRAMQAHQYDLQALIYGVALHRYLSYRLDDYTPQRYLGDSIYLFVRGLDLAPGAGVWRRPIDIAQVLAADRLLEGSA